MKTLMFALALTTGLALALSGCSETPITPVADSGTDSLAGGTDKSDYDEGSGAIVVANRASGSITVINAQTAELIKTIDLPMFAGDATMAVNGQYFYTTNLPGGGAGALYTIMTRGNEVVGSPVDTPYAVPHNLALTPNGKMLFVTHSGGTSDKVTVYRLSGNDRTPEYYGEILVGLNPFGIGYVD